MSRIWRSTLLTIATLTVAIVGAVDAGRDRDGDLLVVFLFVAALQLVVLVAGRPRDRQAVLVRRDLADWLDEQAQRTGDTVDQIVDRMTAQYRALWSPEA